MSKDRIGAGSAMIIVTTAIFFDFIQFIFDVFLIGIILNWFVDIIAWLTFYIWFKILGVNFSNTKNLVAFLGGILIESVPILNALPGWTMSVLAVCVIARNEDKIENEKIKKVIQQEEL